ncbi:OmpA family protein [Roseovarius arcticus]|uniref:OmpA family protein n=1 Tax=Roseovarius arcticus TaxID=2547404 RepID=UPI001FE2C688|nr:OmpA family protein [Roseovarius arcticus]
MQIKTLCAVVVTAGLLGMPATSQQVSDPPQSVEPEEGITILFTTGSSALKQDQQSQLDQASRLFRDGNPVVMIITGTADTVGSPQANLDLSIRRARAVATGLVDRGIPIERLQVLGQGNSELPETTQDEVSNANNRSARITWR